MKRCGISCDSRSSRGLLSFKFVSRLFVCIAISWRFLLLLAEQKKIRLCEMYAAGRKRLAPHNGSWRYVNANNAWLCYIKSCFLGKLK